jgi:hypothetical protein
MATTIKTKKLVYEGSLVRVKQDDVFNHPTLGPLTVESVSASRKKHSSGKVKLKDSLGRVADYPPGIINATWI